MISYVLLNKKTGELLEGLRITFMDKDHIRQTFSEKSTWRICVVAHDGWVIRGLVPVWYFFNRRIKNTFIDLGEL